MASSSVLTAQTEVPHALSASWFTWRTMSQGSTSSTCTAITALTHKSSAHLEAASPVHPAGSSRGWWREHDPCKHGALSSRARTCQGGVRSTFFPLSMRCVCSFRLLSLLPDEEPAASMGFRSHITEASSPLCCSPSGWSQPDCAMSNAALSVCHCLQKVRNEIA